MPGMKGLDRLLRKLDELGGNSPDALKTAMLQAAKKVQGDAKDLAPVGQIDGGTLRDSIQASVEEKSGKIIGKVSTNVYYAPYVEFGTGPVGEVSNKDLPKNVQPSYKQDGWWIHESQIDAETAEKYHFRRIETEAGVFYYTRGQPAQPFLYPAAKQNEQTVVKIVADHLKKEIRKLVK